MFGAQMTRASSLTRRALQPGVSLFHDPVYLCPVDALHALGRCKTELGAALVHARFGDVDINRLRLALAANIPDIFASKEWTLASRQKTEGEVLVGFINQVIAEFLGEPCRSCRGRGYLGMVYGDVWHKLHTCDQCHGRGDIIARTSSWSIETRAPLEFVKPCPKCRGKGLTEVMHERKDRKLRPCQKCAALGQVKGSLRQRALAIGVGKTTVARVWAARFDAVLKLLKITQNAVLYGSQELLYGDE